MLKILTSLSYFPRIYPAVFGVFCNACHSLTDSLTPSCLLNLIDVTLACEDANSKLVEVVTVADVDSEDHVGNSLLQIWELTFGPSDFEHKGWSRF